MRPEHLPKRLESSCSTVYQPGTSKACQNLPLHAHTSATSQAAPNVPAREQQRRRRPRQAVQALDPPTTQPRRPCRAGAAPVTACQPWTPERAGCSLPAVAAPSSCSQRCTDAPLHTCDALAGKLSNSPTSDQRHPARLSPRHTHASRASRSRRTPNVMTTRNTHTAAHSALR